MKNSIILEIFRENRGSIDAIQIDKDMSNIHKVDEIYNLLKKQVSEDTLKLIDELSHHLQADLVEEVNLYFVEGFKMGMRMGIECLEDKPNT